MLSLIQFIELSQNPSQLLTVTVDRKACGHSGTVEAQISYDCAVEDINNAQLTGTHINVIATLILRFIKDCLIPALTPPLSDLESPYATLRQIII